jgi:hypothetical protein
MQDTAWTMARHQLIHFIAHIFSVSGLRGFLLRIARQYREMCEDKGRVKSLSFHFEIIVNCDAVPVSKKTYRSRKWTGKCCSCIQEFIRASAKYHISIESCDNAILIIVYFLSGYSLIAVASMVCSLFR